MGASTSQLRDEALAIWAAGVAAVDSAQLVRQSVSVWRGGLLICGRVWRSQAASRICVVGAGKAGAGMVSGLRAALGEAWLSRTSGWVNVPDDCVEVAVAGRGRTGDSADGPGAIHLHGARPAGVNEPTPAGVRGTEEILNRVGNLGPADLCLVLISGGGSALMPAPAEGISLAAKLQVTRGLSRAGATIEELNTVRRALSRVKGGGLLRACRAGQLVALIISDVIGDPLETIASGPTVAARPNPAAALDVLRRYRGRFEFPDGVEAFLQRQSAAPAAPDELPLPPAANFIIGNNRTAVEASAAEARRRGCVVAGLEWDQPGVAREFGAQFAQRLLQVQSQSGVGERRCLISGGETTVQVAATGGPQKGGRNQEAALAAAVELLSAPAPGRRNVSLVAGGTDGEDGPTDAAGAWVDADLLDRIAASGCDPQAYLRINNSYEFFERLGGLLKTGPTHTNVMDLRVGVAIGTSREEN